jgi:hypothetical protein
MKPIFYTIGDSFTRGCRTDNPEQDKNDKFRNYKGTLGSYGDWVFQNYNRRFERHINLSVGDHDNEDIVRICHILRENVISKDFILIGLTNPSRGLPNDTPTKQIVSDFINQIQEIQYFLDGYNYLITFAFSSLVPYWTSSRILKRKIKDTSKIIEWAKPNNTLHDICSGTWLQEGNVNPLMSEVTDNSGNVSVNHGLGFSDANRFNPYHHLGRNFCNDFHPSTDGHELIANTLIPYIDESLDS